MIGLTEKEASDILAERLLVASRAAGVGIWDWDLVTGQMNYSDLAKEICGFPQDGEVTVDMVRDVTHPEDLPHTWSASERVLDPEIRAEENYIYRIQRYDTGEVRWVRAHGIARFRELDGKHEAVRYTGSIQDVTERELAERAAAQGEAHLRLAIDTAGMAVWDLDLAADEVSHSPELNRLFGFPVDAKPSADDLRARYAEGERERLEAEGAAAMARGDTMIQTRVRYDIPGRGEITCVLRASLAADEKGGPRRVIGVLYDITDQARAEQRLRTVNRELVHRLKNIVSIAGIFAKQTWPRGAPMDVYLGRLRALTLSTDLMFGESQERLTLHRLVAHSLDAFRSADCNPFEVQGPDIELAERDANGVALVLHELATNAMKHGSLSVPEGRVRLSFQKQDDVFRIDWVEANGPPVEPPSRSGFGSVLLERGALNPPHTVKLEFLETGLHAVIALRQMH